MTKIGIEATFYIWLKQHPEYGNCDITYPLIYEETEKPLICPLCKNTYSLPEGNEIAYDSNKVRIKGKEFRGNCSKDGAALEFYLVGKDPTGLGLKHTEAREDFIRFILNGIEEDKKERVYKTSGYVAALGNMTEGTALKVLHRLSDKYPSEVIERRYDRNLNKEEYLFRLNSNGKEKIEDIEKKYREMFLLVPLKDFMEEVFEYFENNGIIELREREIKDTVISIDGKFKEKTTSMKIFDVPAKKRKIADEYFEEYYKWFKKNK